jgi:predicted GNAT family N-acyltransferase
MGFCLFCSSSDNDKMMPFVGHKRAQPFRDYSDSYRQGNAMVTSSIRWPSDCSPQALADFENLVIEAGTVDPQGLTQRIRDASRLLFLRESNGQLVGVGALKHPLLSYRSKVFAKARATASSDEYRIELGWIAVAKLHQGRGLSRRIIGELISLAENENLFATIRADARAMRFAADYGFKPAGKPYPSGRGYDLVLYLRDAKGKRQEAKLESKKTQHQ